MEMGGHLPSCHRLGPAEDTGVASSDSSPLALPLGTNGIFENTSASSRPGPFIIKVLMTIITLSLSLRCPAPTRRPAAAPPDQTWAREWACSRKFSQTRSFPGLPAHWPCLTLLLAIPSQGESHSLLCFSFKFPKPSAVPHQGHVTLLSVHTSARTHRFPFLSTC